MFQSGLFWMLLAFSVCVFWSLPKSWRAVFLVFTSIGYVAVQGSWTTQSLRAAGLMTAGILAWSLVFYLLSPLALPRRRTSVVPSMPASCIPGLNLAEEGCTTVLVAAPPSSPRPSQLRGRRWILWTLIGAVLAYLAWFKYVMPWLHPAGETDLGQAYLMPLGISYFTFKFIHYAVEVARGNIQDRSIWRYLEYVFLFPTFTAGPIERFDHFLKHSAEPWSIQLLTDGLNRIAWGIVKKFYFSEILFGEDFRYAFYGNLVANINSLSTLHVWRIAIVSYLYLYSEFSGYCDIALGACRLFGITIMENFDYPILANNIAEFWKRWHMTLSGWCQTYVYMPVLGMTRRPLLATYATFIAIGLWHGATPKWIAWGAYHASGLVVYQKWLRTWRSRKWAWPLTRAWQLAGITMTLLFVSAGDLLTFAAANGSHDIVRIMGRLAFLSLR